MCSEKVAGRDFRNYLSSCMGYLGFTACLANLDVWMRPVIKSNPQENYEFVMLRVDDALVVV